MDIENVLIREKKMSSDLNTGFGTDFQLYFAGFLSSRTVGIVRLFVLHIPSLSLHDGIECIFCTSVRMLVALSFSPR